jgi:hypothetical protein
MLGREDPPSRQARNRHLALLLDIATDEANDREKRGVTGRPVLWAIERRQILEDLARWYDVEITQLDHPRLIPGSFEAAFGGATYGYGKGDEDALTRAEPLVLDAGGKPLLLQGRIDRIDWDEAHSHFRVIDYKTGRSTARAAFDGGSALQLPVYLRAAAEMLGLPPEHGEAEYFFCTRRGEYRRRGITGAELAAREQALSQILETIVSGIDEGYFAPYPGKAKGNCRWCDYRDICDARIDTIMDRKAGDARGGAFIAMKEIP